MFLKKLLWTLPFICFVAGYYTTSLFIAHSPTTITPELIGKNCTDALSYTSQANLSLKIVAIKENKNSKQPTVLEQTPAQGVVVKTRSTVHIIIAQPPATPLTQDFIHTPEHLWNVGENVSIIPIASHNTGKEKNTIAQWPEPGTPLQETTTIYSEQEPENYIMPNLIGQALYKAEDLLKKYEIHYQIHSQPDRKHSSTDSPINDFLPETAPIIDQQPKAGSIFSVKNAPTMHLVI